MTTIDPVYVKFFKAWLDFEFAVGGRTHQINTEGFKFPDGTVISEGDLFSATFDDIDEDEPDQYNVYEDDDGHNCVTS
jgi:hypothetical protein